MSDNPDLNARMQNISFLNEMENILRNKIPESAEGEIRRIVSNREGINFIGLMTGEILLSDDDKSDIQSSVKRRMRGEPLEYILKKTSFMDIDLNIPHGVFIPRPETQVLVDEAFECAHHMNKDCPEALDLGTGSGNILIALCKRLPRLKATGIDISQEAVDAAKNNVSYYEMEDSIKILKMDYQSRDFACDSNRYDMIVTNPPYVGRKEYLRLQAEVRHEPTQALIGGDSGFELPRWIIRRVRSKVNDGGYLIMEIGKGQDQILGNEINRVPGWELLKIVDDENSIPRVLVARANGRG